MITENGEKVMMMVPTTISNWILKEYEIMGEGKQIFEQEINKIALFEYDLPGNGENMPFSFCLL